MATILCSTACGAVATVPTSYWDECAGNVFRKYGFNYVALIKCDVNIPDPTDLTAWDALVASGDIQIMPKGKLDIPQPDVETSSDIDFCGGDTVLSITYNLTYQTYQTADDSSDYIYFQNLLKNHANYRMVWFDCDGNVNMSDEYIDFVDGTSAVAPTGNPGHAFSISAPPHPEEGDGQRVRWGFTAQIELSGDEILRQTSLPGLLASVQG